MSSGSPPVSPYSAKINGREQDVKSYVSEMLEEMESDFEQVGNSLLSRMQRMGRKMDRLEDSIGNLMTDAGLAELRHEAAGGGGRPSTLSPSASVDSQQQDKKRRPTSSDHNNNNNKAVL